VRKIQWWKIYWNMKRIRARSSTALVSPTERQTSHCFARPTGGLITPPKSTHAPSRKTTTGFTVSRGYHDTLYDVRIQHIYISGNK